MSKELFLKDYVSGSYTVKNVPHLILTVGVKHFEEGIASDVLYNVLKQLEKMRAEGVFIQEYTLPN